MTHRYVELPFPGDIVALDHGVAWTRGHVGSVHVAAIDVDTGATRLATVGADGSGRGALAPIDGVLVATVGRGAVQWFDAATGASIHKTEGALCGTTRRGAVILVRRKFDSGTCAIVEVLGTSERTLLLTEQEGPERDVVLGHERAWMLQGRRLFGAPLAPGEATVEFAVPHDASLVAWRDDVLVVETLLHPDGIRTRFHAIEGSALREVAVVEGEVVAPRSATTRDLLFASVRGESASTTCVVVDLARGEEVARIQSAGHVCATSHDVGAVAQAGAITVFAHRDGVLATQRIAFPPVVDDAADAPNLPPSGVASLAVGLRSVLAALGRRLFVIALDELPWRDADLRFNPVAPPRVGDPVPAQVVFAGAALVLTQHPRLGRVSLKLVPPTPVLVKGDRIVFDELRETTPGKVTVVAWHKDGESASTTAPTPLLSRASDLGQAAWTPPAFEAGTSLATLQAAAMRLGFAIGPLLEKFLALHDRDPGFRRLLDRVSLLVEVTGGTTAWSGSDPCMLGLAGNGGGDVVALYFYPPGHTPGAELPVVRWLHEDNSVDWCASSFEAYLASRLQEDKDASWNSVVQAIRAALGFSLPAVEKAKPPLWFEAAHCRGAGSSDGDDLARERRLVSCLCDDPEDDDAKAELAAVYERLGWQWHAEQLRDAED